MTLRLLTSKWGRQKKRKTAAGTRKGRGRRREMFNCQRAGSFRCKRALEVGDRNPQEQNTVATWNPCLCSARIGEVVQMREVGCRHNRAVNSMTTSLEPLPRRHKISPELRMAPTFRNLTWGVSSKWVRVFLRFGTVVGIGLKGNQKRHR